ncbi:hypothetical protein BB561_001274 [Smittium simulii]|uniref:PCI domain-containing protein n=1 Tax=Smittium simulii TaxID=133385 RepID=A0A2T9YVG0_9FUNG|nr:hypothetical protein BB561_001274 [Smittium simulii]
MTSIIFSNEELSEKILAFSAGLSGSTEDQQPTSEVYKQVQLLSASADYTQAFELALSELPCIFEKNPENLSSILNYAFILLLNLPTASHVSNINIIFKHLENSALDISFQLKCLNTLYNIKQTTPALQHAIFVMILNICTKNGLVKSILCSHINSLLEYTANWKLSPAESLEFLNLFLASISKENLQADAITLEKIILSSELPLDQTKSSQMALSLIVKTINCIDYYSFYQLAEIPAIASLSSSFEYSILAHFLQESHTSWSDFVASNKDKLASLNVDVETATNKLQILALNSIGNQNLGKKISYSTISKRVFADEVEDSDLRDFEIESIIIDSIKTGLISAKIDQLDRSVIITRSTARKFGPEQWSNILDHLNSWKSSLSSLLPVINNGKLMTQLSLSSASDAAIVEIKTDSSSK